MANLLFSVLPEPRRPIVYIHPDVTVAQCIEIMTNQDIGALVVTDDINLLGMVTERDVVRNCLYRGLDPHQVHVREISCATVSVLDISDPIEKAMETITRTKRRHLLIAEQGQIVAILSIGDVLFYLLEDNKRIIEHLEKYIHA